MVSAIRQLWVGTADIIESVTEYDPVTHLTRVRDKVVATKVPCRISFKSFNPTSQSETVGSYVQKTVVIMGNEYVVKPGTRFLVTQNNRTTKYACSSEPAVYSNHQEVEVTKEDTA